MSQRVLRQPHRDHVNSIAFVQRRPMSPAMKKKGYLKYIDLNFAPRHDPEHIPAKPRMLARTATAPNSARSTARNSVRKLALDAMQDGGTGCLADHEGGCLLASIQPHRSPEPLQRLPRLEVWLPLSPPSPPGQKRLAGSNQPS